jgi:hypothetical protein
VDPEGHYLHGPTVPEHVRASLADLIFELEAAQVDGLDSRRNEFRDSCRVTDTGQTLADLSERMRVERRILDMRFELLVAVQVQRAGVLVQMRADTPDFDCRYRDLEFGVEATTRARAEVASALHGFLEAGLYEGPDVQVVLNPTSERLYTKSPEEIRRVAERILAQIEANQSAARSPYSIPVPELRLTAFLWPGCGIGPGLRVAYQAMHTLDDGAAPPMIAAAERGVLVHTCAGSVCSGPPGYSGRRTHIGSTLVMGPVVACSAGPATIGGRSATTVFESSDATYTCRSRIRVPRAAG